MQSLGCSPHTLSVQGHYSVPNLDNSSGKWLSWWTKKSVMVPKLTLVSKLMIRTRKRFVRWRSDFQRWEMLGIASSHQMLVCYRSWWKVNQEVSVMTTIYYELYFWWMADMSFIMNRTWHCLVMCVYSSTHDHLSQWCPFYFWANTIQRLVMIKKYEWWMCHFNPIELWLVLWL